MSKHIGKIMSAVGGLLLIIYLGYQIFFAGSSSVKTEAAIHYTANDSVNTTGYIIRDEQLETTQLDGVLSYTVADGQRVAKGGIIANVFSNSQAAEKQAQIDQLKKQLSTLELISGMNGGAVTDLERVNDAVYVSLADAVYSAAHGRFNNVDDTSDQLFAAINRRLVVTEGSIDLSDTISSIESQIKSLEAAVKGEGAAVEADRAGYFVSRADGYEQVLTFDMLESLTPDVLSNIKPGVAPDDCVGKTVGQVDWYIAATVSMEQSLRFKEGQQLHVKMPLSTVDMLPVTVSRINKSSVTGDAVVILKCNYMNGELACIRTQPTEIILNSCSGLRVSSTAVRTVDGKYGVYIVSGTQLKFVNIEIIYTGKGFIICKMDGTGDGLRLYDDVVVGGKDLYDGKVVK